MKLTSIVITLLLALLGFAAAKESTIRANRKLAAGGNKCDAACKIRLAACLASCEPKDPDCKGSKGGGNNCGKTDPHCVRDCHQNSALPPTRA
jgi:hypothetical protein